MAVFDSMSHPSQPEHSKTVMDPIIVQGPESRTRRQIVADKCASIIQEFRSGQISNRKASILLEEILLFDNMSTAQAFFIFFMLGPFLFAVSSYFESFFFYFSIFHFSFGWMYLFLKFSKEKKWVVFSPVCRVFEALLV